MGRGAGETLNVRFELLSLDTEPKIRRGRKDEVSICYILSVKRTDIT